MYKLIPNAINSFDPQHPRCTLRRQGTRDSLLESDLTLLRRHIPALQLEISSFLALLLFSKNPHPHFVFPPYPKKIVTKSISQVKLAAKCLQGALYDHPDETLVSYSAFQQLFAFLWSRLAINPNFPLRPISPPIFDL